MRSVVSDKNLNPEFHGWGQQNSVSSIGVSVTEDFHITWNQPDSASPEQSVLLSSRDQCVQRSPFHPQECALTRDSRFGLCPETFAQNLSLAQRHSQRTLVCKTDKQSHLSVTNQGCYEWKLCSDFGTACTPVRSKSVKLDWQWPSFRSRSSSVTSGVCSYSHCGLTDQILADKDVRESQVSVGINIAHRHSSANSNSCSLSFHESSRERCQQPKQLHLSSQSRLVLHQHEQAHIADTNPEQNTQLPLTTDCISYSPDLELSDSQRGSFCQKRSQWRRMVYMRCVVRCFLLLLLAAVGGLVAHVTTNAHKTVNDEASSGAKIHPAFNVSVKFQKIPVRWREEFRNRLDHAKQQFQYLRVYLAEKNVSDDDLIRMLALSVIQSMKGFKPSAKKALDSDLHNDDIVEEDVNMQQFDPELHQEEDLNKVTKSETQKDHKNDAKKSDVFLKAEKKSGADLKIGETLLGETKLREYLSIRGAPLSVLSSMDTQNKPMNADSKGSATRVLSTTHTDISENKPTSIKISNNKEDVSVDEIPVTKVKKREMTYDDEDYPEEKEDVNLEDYFDEEAGKISPFKLGSFFEVLEEVLHAAQEMEDNHQTLCRDARPSVLRIEDPKKQNRQFYPQCTVVHRCRSDSGCCPSNHECGPKTEQVITRSFLVLIMNTTTKTMVPHPQIVEQIELVNHTECHCREKPRLSECNGKCPGVFRMYRYGTQCVCDCLSTSQYRFPQCDDVKVGLEPLSPDDLVCVRSGRCGRPRCSIGQFNLSSGFCPFKDLPFIPRHRIRHRLRHQRRLRQHKPPKPAVEGSGDF